VINVKIFLPSSVKDSEPVVVLEYQPVYGPVPGYIDGTDLGAPIHITVQKQGGASNGEWRVISGAF
jgi:pyruvate/2-oxoglutarate/acetoin dehydrogenase E1 component